MTSKCALTGTRVLWMIMLCMLTEFGYATGWTELSMCSQALDVNQSDIALSNASCVYQRCSDSEATLKIPIALLEGYKDYSYIVLVTENGCSVEEKKDEKGVPRLIHLEVPFDNCGTQAQKINQALHYYNRPYISYIGKSWKLYFLNVSCVTKQKLPVGPADWNAVPNVKEHCWSSDDSFTVPKISDLTITVDVFRQQKVPVQRTREKRLKQVYTMENPKTYQVFPLSQDASRNSFLLKPDPKFDSGQHLMGSAVGGRAAGAIFSGHRGAAVATAYGQNRRAAFSLLPSCALGNEYVVVSYPSRDSNVIITAPRPGILGPPPPVDVKIYSPNGSFVTNVTLSYLESTFIPNATTGYRISSDRPVAAFTVMLDAKVPYNSSEASVTVDHMAEQLPPVTLWGSEYVVHQIAPAKNRAGFLLALVAYKRTVRLRYFGISDRNLPTVVLPFSIETVDADRDWPPFIVKSQDDTNFMAAVFGKSGNASKTGPKAYPFMLILQPTRSYISVSHTQSTGNASVSAINLAVGLRTQPEISFMNNSTTIPEIYWDNVSCSGNLSCSDPNFAYFQYEAPVENSSLFYSKLQGFGSAVFGSGFKDSGGSTAYLGPVKFQHRQLQDHYCEIGWTYYENTRECIKIGKGPMAWSDAKDHCEKARGTGASLLTLKNADKERFVVDLVAQLRISHVHIGFHMNKQGDLTWLDGGAVYWNGLLVQKYGTDATANCGYMRIDYEHDVYKQYIIQPTYCWTTIGFVCQKDAIPVKAPTTVPVLETTVDLTTRAVTTIPASTTAPNSSCETNPCLNGGTCLILANISTACKCSETYSGPYCGEYNLPASGVYAVRGRGIRSLMSLLQLSRRKRGNGGSRRKKPKFTELTFEIHEFGGMRGFRLLTGCPQSPLCYGWLGWDVYRRVGVANAKYGAHLLQMTPEMGGYTISFDLGHNFISSDGRFFYLSRKGPQTVVFQLRKLHEIGELQRRPPYRLKMKRFELPGHFQTGGHQLVVIPLNTKNCRVSTTEVTACVWFRSFRGPDFSPVIPLVIYNVSQPRLASILNGTDTREALEQYEVFVVKPTMTSNDTTRIDVIDSSNVTVASTNNFKVPAVGYRHHLCLQNSKVTVDGMQFPLRLRSGSTLVMVQNSPFLANGKYVGQIDGMDVWCGSKSNAFLLRESGILPECGGRRGDLASAQAGDCLLSKSVKQSDIFTPENACQFCPLDWVLHHGSCYHVVSEMRSALGGGMCKPTNPVGQPIPWLAVARLPTAHYLLAKYVDASLGNQRGSAWFGLYRDMEKVWKWRVHPPAFPLSAYWGPAEPKAFEYSRSEVCAAYKPFQSNLQLEPMPVTSDVYFGPSSPNGYQWTAEFCYHKMPYICQQPCAVLDPGKHTLLRVFMLGGSYVSHMSRPEELVAARTTIATVIDVITMATSGRITYELLRIRSVPTPYFKTNDVQSMKKHVVGWRPFPGEPDLGKVVQYINLHSKDEQYRYINIVTSAYLQSVGPVTTDSKSSTFALGIMWRRVKPISMLEDHLRSIATHPYCIGLADTRTSLDIARRVTGCVTGIHTVEDGRMKPMGRSMDRRVMHIDVGGAATVTYANATATPAFNATPTAITGASVADEGANLTTRSNNVVTTERAYVSSAAVTSSIHTVGGAATVTYANATATPAFNATPTAITGASVADESANLTTRSSNVVTTERAYVSSAAVTSSIHTVTQTISLQNSTPSNTSVDTPADTASASSQVNFTTQPPVTSSTHTVTPTNPNPPFILVNSSEYCPPGYEGYGCAERAPPRSGLFEISAAVDLSGLFPKLTTRKRRSTSSKSYILQFLEISGHYAIRSMHDCPKSPYCLWWLNTENDVKVQFVSPDKGYALWDITPLPGKNSYIISSATSGKYLKQAGNEFILVGNQTEAVALTAKASRAEILNSTLEEMVESFGAEFFDPNSSAIIEIPTPANFCSSWSICFQFRALSSSPVEYPAMSWRSQSTLIRASGANPQNKQWGGICSVLSIKSTVTWTLHIGNLRPVVVSRVKYTAASCAKAFFIGLHSKVYGRRFVGYIKNVNAWSKELSAKEVQHVFTASCEPYKGDIFSPDQPLNGTGFVATKHRTLKSACRYCEFQWTSAGDSCFTISNRRTTNYLREDQCKKLVDQSSHVPIVDNDQAHYAIQALAERNYARGRFPFIPLYYRPQTSRYEWMTFGAQVDYTNRTYWGLTPPIPPILNRNCVVYAPKNRNPRIAYNVPFAWEPEKCRRRGQFVCEAPAGIFPPGVKVQITVIMPHSASMTEDSKNLLRLLLVKMLDMIVTKSAKFIFVMPPKVEITGPYPDPRKVVFTWDQNSTMTPLSQTLQNVNSLVNLSTNGSFVSYAVVVVQNATNVTKEEVNDAFPNATVFILGLENTTLQGLQELATKEYAALIPESIDKSLKNKIRSSFQRFLQGLSLPVLIQNPDATSSTACRNVTCQNNGTCVPTVGINSICKCASGFAGEFCEFESPSVLCEDAGVRVEVSVDIVRSLSGTPSTKTPVNVMLYFANHKATSTCMTKSVTNGTKNETVYSLYAPAPIGVCGLVATQRSNSPIVEVIGAVFYKRITKVTVVDTRILVSNFTCVYKTKYGIGLRPDEMLSAEFKPVPNSLFSGRVQRSGNFVVLIQFFLDAEHKIPLPSDSQVKVGTFLHVSVLSKSPLPPTMWLNVDNCYLGTHPDPRVRMAILGIMKNNCHVSNSLPKTVTSVKKDEVSFAFQVFQWRNGAGAMYLHCTTSICDTATTKCNTYCSSAPTRTKRQSSRGDEERPLPKIVHTIPIHTAKEEGRSDKSSTGLERLGVFHRYLVENGEIRRYLLAGLILFTFLFFSFVIVVILYHFRSPNLDKHLLHARCSYRRGRRLSDSPPRTWTVVHALSPPVRPDASVTEPRRRRAYVTAENSRVDEVLSPNATRFSTFLGEPDAPKALSEANARDASTQFDDGAM